LNYTTNCKVLLSISSAATGQSKMSITAENYGINYHKNPTTFNPFQQIIRTKHLLVHQNKVEVSIIISAVARCC